MENNPSLEKVTIPSFFKKHPIGSTLYIKAGWYGHDMMPAKVVAHGNPKDKIIYIQYEDGTVTHCESTSVVSLSYLEDRVENMKAGLAKAEANVVKLKELLDKRKENQS
jgi:hypothetical protein